MSLPSSPRREKVDRFLVVKLRSGWKRCRAHVPRESLVAKAFSPALQTKQLCNGKKPGCAWISDTKMQKAGRKQRIAARKRILPKAQVPNMNTL